MSAVLASLFASGFFSSEAVQIALGVGVIVAIVAAPVGVLTVIRRQSFAGHAFGDIGTAGASASFLVGLTPLWGLLLANLAGGAAMEGAGVERARSRDIATGIVLGAALSLAALFLYLDMTSTSTTGQTVTILFGSIFAIPTSTLPLAGGLGGVVLLVTLIFARPLLLSSVSPEIASAKGLPVRALSLLFLLTLGLAAALAAVTIGTILSTALLIGPAASALRLTKRPLSAVLLSALIGIFAIVVGIVLAYDSYRWPPGDRTWPVSFFVVMLVFAAYLLSGVPDLVRRRRQDSWSAAGGARSGAGQRSTGDDRSTGGQRSGAGQRARGHEPHHRGGAGPLGEMEA